VGGPDIWSKTLDGLPAPHLPRSAEIEAYGHGGFRFAGMSHRGSLLCLPDGIWAWPVAQPDDITEAALAAVFARAGTGGVTLLLIGSGREPWTMPSALRACCRERNLTVETTRTGTAVATYNILVGEGRQVAAALIALE
jgi:uncharacterized protein